MSLTFPTVAAALLLVVVATLAMAQSPSPPVAEPSDQARPQSAKGSRAKGASYSSVFDGYRRFSDQSVGSWRQANDTVGQVGGWQAYAREAQGTQERAPAPGADSKAPASSTPRDQTGHH